MINGDRLAFNGECKKLGERHEEPRLRGHAAVKATDTECRWFYHFMFKILREKQQKPSLPFVPTQQRYVLIAVSCLTWYISVFYENALTLRFL
jgi:hypothetical protein